MRKQRYDIDGVGGKMLAFMARNAPVIAAQMQPASMQFGAFGKLAL